MNDIKVKDLIRILQGVNPEKSIVFHLGEGHEDSESICKAGIINSDNIDILDIAAIKIFAISDEDYDIRIHIALCPRNWTTVFDDAEKFDKQFKKV